MTIRILILIFIAVLSPFTGLFAQFDTLRVMYYNTLNYPDGGDPNREDYFRIINGYLDADVILVNELTSENGANILLNQALNVFGKSKYQRAVYTDGPDTDNMLFYNSDKLTLYSQWYIQTPLRHINEYILYYKSSDLTAGADTIFFYFYSAHLKAFPEDSLNRLAEVADFKSRVDGLANAENIIFGGDLNLYTSNEPAYQSLINDGIYPLHDPLPAGDWHSDYSFRYLHTQSTRTASFGGGSTGGLDDRFDLILFSGDVLNGDNRVHYVSNSCEAFGNDGNHFNDALIDFPLNPDIPDSVTYALYNMSDHLPVICNLAVEAQQDTTNSALVITEIMYNPPELGLDSLEFIEIYNNGSAPENLGGYYFSQGVNFTFPAVTLNPGEFVLTAINAAAFYNTFGMNAYQWTSDGLNNSGELILLKDNFGKTIDSVWYEDGLPWPAGTDGQGASLMLCDPGSDNSLPAAWTASTNFVTNNQMGNPVYASPGFSECSFPPVADFSASLQEVYPGGSVEFTDISTNDPVSWNWIFEGGNPANSISQNPTVFYNSPGVFSVELTVSNAAGSDTRIKTGYISVLSDTYDLVITEIMKNPSATADGDGEWFELYNPTPFPVDLLNWTIQDNDYDTHVINSSVIVPPGGFAVLGINAVSATNGNYVCDYQYSDFYLANSGDEIVLLDPSNNEIDRIEYDGGTNWPDPNGSSMVFTGNAADDNNIYSNWSVSNSREPTFIGSAGDAGSPGSNGNQQNLEQPGFSINIKVFLEGPFDGSNMQTGLSQLSTFPSTQPYNTAPWNYLGSESFSGSTPLDVVDWLLIEIRDAENISSATSSAIVAQKAVLLKETGNIVSSSDFGIPEFNFNIVNQLFLVVYHRNSLPVISSSPLVESSGVYSWDFTTGAGQAYNNGQKELAPGIFGMYAGDCDGDGTIQSSDISDVWQNEAATKGYLPADVNMDAEVNNIDKNDFWYPNLGEGSQIPE
ncbi:MAG: lamin tail domain-containing protein [Bacteroidales bacterium]|nr:lamin tail domain-containing protein [Bacteroidales bacterium]